MNKGTDWFAKPKQPNQRNFEILIATVLFISLIAWNALLLYALAKVIDILLLMV